MLRIFWMYFLSDFSFAWTCRWTLNIWMSLELRMSQMWVVERPGLSVFYSQLCRMNCEIFFQSSHNRTNRCSEVLSPSRSHFAVPPSQPREIGLRWSQVGLTGVSKPLMRGTWWQSAQRIEEVVSRRTRIWYNLNLVWFNTHYLTCEDGWVGSAKLKSGVAMPLPQDLCSFSPTLITSRSLGTSPTLLWTVGCRTVG